MKTLAFAVLFLMAAASAPSLSALNMTRSSGQSLTQGFNVINSVWGTTNSPTDAAPGDIGDTLTLTLQYVYSATAESIDAYLQLPSGFSLYNGSNVSFSAISGIYPTGSTIQLSFPMDISSNLSLGTYPTSLQLSWTAAGYSYLLNDTVPVTIQVEGRPQLYFSYSGSGLEAGQLNQIPINISNNGTGAASNILVTSASQIGGVLNSIPEIENLKAGSMTTASLEVYVPASSAGGVLALSLSSTFKDPYGYEQSAAQPLNIYVQPSTSISNVSVDLIPKNITVMASQQSVVSFEIVNTGNTTMYSPTITIGVSSPLVIVANSTFAFNGAIKPNDSILFEATLTASPSSSLGTYSGTVSVKYEDQLGTQHSQSFNVGFVLSASINLVVESETVTQSSRALSVSGTFLNEGLASAYYAEVVGCVVQTNFTASLSNATVTRSGIGRNSTSSGAATVSSVTTVATFTRNFTGPFPRSGSGFNGGLPAGAATLSTCPSTAASSYVGEIDPNSPVAFTTSAAYTPSNASSNAVLVLVITYQNTFGTHTTQPVDKPITLTASSIGTQSQPQTTQGASHLVVKIAFYTVIIAVVVSALAGVIFARRNRRSRSAGEEKVV